MNLKDDFHIVVSNKDIIKLMGNIETNIFADERLIDDFVQTKEFLLQNYPFEYAILINVATIISNTLLEPEFGPVELIEHKLNKGRHDGNTVYHYDKTGGDHPDGIYKDIDFICLYYFNTLQTGPLCVKNKYNEYFYYPKKGNLAIINELNPTVKHKIEPYDWKNIERYTARFGFKLL